MIRLLDLKPHPEGGHFRETFRDARSLIDGKRPRGLDRDLFSARARRALALASHRRRRSLALVRRRAAQARHCAGHGSARARDAWEAISPPANGRRRSCRRTPGRRRKRSATGRSSAARSRPASTSRSSSWRRRAGSPNKGRTSNHVLAAVRGQRRAGDEARIVRGEEDNAARDLFRLAQAAERDRAAGCSSPAHPSAPP